MLFRRLALFLVVVALVGCNNEKNRNLIDKRMDQAIRMGEEAQTPAPKVPFDPLRVTDKVWAGNAALRMRSGMPLPSRFEGPRGVTLIASEPMSLTEISSMIAGQTGIPMRPATGMGGAGSAGSSGMGGGGSSSSSSSMQVAYEGPLSGLLDLVAGHYGLNWRYDGASISMSRFVTRVFVVESLPGTQTIKDGIKEDTDSGSSSSSSSGGGSSTSSLTQSTEMNVEMKVWDEIGQTIQAMLGGIGNAVVSPSSGTVTVTTSPDLMRTVAKFIEEENRRLSQQIGINVEVYTVALQDGSDFNVAFSTALDRLSIIHSDVSGATGPSAGGTSFGQLSLAIIDNKHFGSVSSLFEALSTVGDTTRVAQFPLTTLNNRPVSRRIGRDRTYVASLTNADTSTTTTTTTSTITPGTIREGFSLQLTPRLLDDGRIMLQYSLSLIDIVDIRSLNTGVGTVELPETSSRVFVQQSLLKSGSTLVLAGYDDEQVSQSSQGMGNPYNYFLGGGAKNNKTRSMIYIAITPQVLDVPKGEVE